MSENYKRKLRSFSKSTLKGDVLESSQSSNNVSPKTTITNVHLKSIYEKIQMHLLGTKTMAKYEIRKLATMLSKMDCPVKEQDYFERAKDVLLTLHKKMVDKNPTTSETESLRELTSLPLSNNDEPMMENLNTNEEIMGTVKYTGLVINAQQKDSQETGEEILSFPQDLLTNNDFIYSVTDGTMSQNPDDNDIFQLNTPIPNLNTQELPEFNVGNKREDDIDQMIGSYEFSQPNGDIPEEKMDLDDKRTYVESPCFTYSLTQRIRASRFAQPSAGSAWKEANVKVGKQVDYVLDESETPDIILIDSVSATPEHLVAANETDDKNSLEVEALLPETEASGHSPNQSFISQEFKTDSSIIEATPFVKPPKPAYNLRLKRKTVPETITKPEDIEIDHELVYMNEEIDKESVLQKSVIDATEDIIINETKSVNNFVPSNSFSTKREVLESWGESAEKSSSNNLIPDIFVNNQDVDQPAPIFQPIASENITVINGSIFKPTESQVHNVEQQETFKDQQRKLQEKIMNKRLKYKSKWQDMSTEEKISKKFADKFHIRIFDEPVEALQNINYVPNMNLFHFERLTPQELHSRMKTCQQIVAPMDLALTKVVREALDDQQSSDVEPEFDSADSDSSSEEGAKGDKKWLKEFMAVTRQEMKEYMEQLKKDEMDFDLVQLNYSEEMNQEKADDTDKKLDELMRKMGDCDWLKEQDGFN